MLGSMKQMDYDSQAYQLSGGTIINYGGYQYRVFTTSGTLSLTGDIVNINVDIWYIGGGGGGDAGQTVPNVYYGGGNPGSTQTYASYSLTPGSYTVTVGAGGTGYNNGSASQFGSLTAASGGSNGSVNSNSSYTPTTATKNYWNIAANNNNFGGYLWPTNIGGDGANYYGAQGGWGQTYPTGQASLGGMPVAAGGSNGVGWINNLNPIDAASNSGSGGGGQGTNTGYPVSPGLGGSGIVIVRIN